MLNYNKVAYFKLSSDFIVDLFSGNNKRFESNLPKDARIIDIKKYQDDVFYVYFISESNKMTHDTEKVPEFNIFLTTKETNDR